MKKSLIIALALVFVLGIAGTAFAAANPFVDVPAKHWAYESVAKLAKAGIVDGYGDGTFRGDRTMTRYEMAVIVAKAMANEDKANAAQKAEIAKLQAEFGDELTKLGVRVSALENKVGNIKFTGEIRTRYEWGKDAATAPGKNLSASNPWFKNRFRLSMEAPVADGWTFKGRYRAENTFRTDPSAAGATTPVDSTATSYLDRAYLTGKAFGLNEFSLGRQGLFLGQGLVVGSPTPYYDGVKIAFGKDIKVQAGAVKSYAFSPIPAGNQNYLFGDVKFIVDKNLNITTTYFKQKDSLYFKTWTAGLGYTGIPNITITGEYGKNAADNIKYNGSDPKGWFARTQYATARPAKVNSADFWVMYSKADPNFEGANFTNLDSPTIYTRTVDDKKGMTYGFDWTVFQNGILSLQYNDLKKVSDDSVKQKSFFAQLNYTF